MTHPPIPPDWFDPKDPSSIALHQVMKAINIETMHATVYDWGKPGVHDSAMGAPAHVAIFQKVGAPAPYVGERFYYLWWVAVDSKTNRQIASTEAIIHYVPLRPDEQ